MRRNMVGTLRNRNAAQDRDYKISSGPGAEEVYNLDFALLLRRRAC